MYQESERKKNNGKKKEMKVEESNVTRDRFRKTSPDYSSSFNSLLYETNASLHF